MEDLDAGIRRAGIAGEKESEAGEAVAPTSKRHPSRGRQDLEIDVGAERAPFEQHRQRAEEPGHADVLGRCGQAGFGDARKQADVVAEAGAVAVIQPGGSLRDAEVIAAGDERGIAMVFTGHRHFRH